ncbi:DUF2235 domain-containing protein [Amycolatopsis sacchari]|uniref:Uncharacterized alpha/beta hydrolase domain n=1 Tax=Amycolatopsis sacchari TaxID=115433 RepID=A0A1I3Q879_9PSEU|nr:DUF2235 domain-containing protein [Amycolatopsis sacchari]SFJ29859.1 Uncharacterized alpha/beta hydrolase domain [Amycolatopsis sacchari]
MRRLVICCDGTWNRPDQLQGGKPCPTNVTKLALAVADETDGVPQLLYYHPGVGTYRRERLRGGAFGFGLSRDVRSAYRFVVDNYQPGDEIFLFGFSRGAYTARSTAGLIRNAGVLRHEHAYRLPEAYDLYRARAVRPRDVESQLFRRSYSHETRIRFIGVWDTVGSLGVPAVGPAFLTRLLNRRWAFHDTELSGRVDGACHAVSIDEKRRPFAPTLWTQREPEPGQVVRQVWFPGVHGDVGGGYPDASAADVALLWMADQAAEFGLGFRKDAFTEAGGWGAEGGSLPAVAPDPAGPLHESRRRFYRLQRPWHRLRHDTPGAAGMALSPTASARYDSDDRYRPPGFAEFRERYGG